MTCLDLASTNPHEASNLHFILAHGVESAECLYYRWLILSGGDKGNWLAWLEKTNRCLHASEEGLVQRLVREQP